MRKARHKKLTTRHNLQLHFVEIQCHALIQAHEIGHLEISPDSEAGIQSPGFSDQPDRHRAHALVIPTSNDHIGRIGRGGRRLRDDSEFFQRTEIVRQHGGTHECLAVRPVNLELRAKWFLGFRIHDIDDPENPPIGENLDILNIVLGCKGHDNWTLPIGRETHHCLLSRSTGGGCDSSHIHTSAANLKRSVRIIVAHASTASAQRHITAGSKIRIKGSRVGQTQQHRNRCRILLRIHAKLSPYDHNSLASLNLNIRIHRQAAEVIRSGGKLPCPGSDNRSVFAEHLELRPRGCHLAHGCGAGLGNQEPIHSIAEDR